jgi:PPOX class probable F420-dependent enzyme
MPERDTPESFLREPNVAILATTGRDGMPHAMPLWYDYEDGEIVMWVARGSVKHRNVERNPEVAFTVDRRVLPYYAVMVQGRAAIGPPPSPELKERIASRYLGEERGRQYAASGGTNEGVTIRLRPSRIVEYRGGSEE